MTTKTPWEIAEAWYTVENIERAIQRKISLPTLGEPGVMDVPRDITSREFAEWLTNEYRLAMAKGIQLGREGEEL